MQTLHSLRSLRDLRAVSPEAAPPADGVPVRCAASAWKGALPLPNLPWPSCALGGRAAASACRMGTGPGSGAVPRGWQVLRAVQPCAPLVGGALPDRVCRAGCLRQTTVSTPVCVLPDGAGHRRWCDTASPGLGGGSVAWRSSPGRSPAGPQALGPRLSPAPPAPYSREGRAALGRSRPLAIPGAGVAFFVLPGG